MILRIVRDSPPAKNIGSSSKWWREKSYFHCKNFKIPIFNSWQQIQFEYIISCTSSPL